jgi:hypothetical protein
MELDGELASMIVWFDALVTNIDRSARNTNMLLWHRRLTLIDHGAALYFHHAGGDFAKRARDPFPQVKDHVLLPWASELEGADARLSARLTPEVVRGIVDLVPDTWLEAPVAALREAYTGYLNGRLAMPRPFLEEAIRARSLHV